MCIRDRNENRKVYNPTSQLFEADPHRDAFEGQDVDKDLARAARASAGFPIAFGPVWESPSLQARAVTPDNTPSWLIDGGCLLYTSRCV